MPFSIAMLHGKDKEKAFNTDSQIYLINYEGLGWLESKLKRSDKHKFDMLVFDESSKIKNTKTKRFKIVKRIAPLFSRRYILTGSPIPNGMKDIYGQVYALDLGKTFGQYITRFLTTYFYPAGYMGYDWRLQPGMEKEIYKKLKNLVLRFGKEEIDLPPLNIVDRKIVLSDKVQKIYKELENEFIIELEAGIVTAANAATAGSKLRQIVSGNIYDENKKAIPIHEEKLEELIEIVEELQGSPCIISYEYRHELAMLQGIFPDAPYIGGGVSAKEGSKIEDRWNRGELPVLLGNPESIAHGLNLQESGHTIIMFSLTWNLENYEQLIQRLWRQGQKNTVTVIHLVAENTIDETIIKALKQKDRTQQNLLNALKEDYLEKPVMADTKIIELFKENIERMGLHMPIYIVNKESLFTTDLSKLISEFSHSDHHLFIQQTTGEDVYNEQELVALHKKTRAIIYKAFDINPEEGVKLKPKTIKLIKKYASKVYKNTPKTYDNTQDEEYLEMNKSKFAPKDKKETSTKKKTAKKKVVSKKKAVSKKKTVSKKKVVSKKKAAASKKINTDAAAKDMTKDLLKLLKNKKGISVSDAADKLHLEESKIRGMIGTIRKQGTEVTSLGKGVFKA